MMNHFIEVTKKYNNKNKTTIFRFA